MFQMPLKRQQEQFSLAYIHAIASVAGYSIEEIRVDIDSIDLSIFQFGDNEIYPDYESLRVQLKCTYKHKPNNGFLNFPLKLKNYNDLRRDNINSRVLLILHIPEDIKNWLIHSNGEMVLKHNCYWMSLRGMPSVDNTDNIAVKIPLSQKLTVVELQRLMGLLANGEKL